ncbi:MAG TPA: sugar phosphate isomerase/epimerase family protein [Chloroflexota bacterium]
MDRNLHSFVKVSIVHFMAFPEVQGGEGPIVETLQHIANDDFFQMVEITSVNSPEVRRQVADLLKASRLEVAFGAQPVLLRGKHDLNAADAEVRKAAVNAVKGAIDEAAEIGARRVGILSGRNVPAEERPAAMERLADSLTQLCAYGRERGVSVVLETFDHDIDKKALVGPTPEAVALAQQIRREYPDFGLMLDLSHLPLQGESTWDALRTAQPVLVHAHIGNCVVRDPQHPLYGDKHPPFGVPGGENDVDEVAEFLRALLEIGYLKDGAPGAVGFEVVPHGQDPIATIQGSKRVLQRAWAIA